MCEKSAQMKGTLLGTDEEPVKSLWVRISRQSNTGDIVLGVSYRQQTSKRQQTRPSADNWKELHIYKSWSSRGASRRIQQT